MKKSIFLSALLYICSMRGVSLAEHKYLVVARILCEADKAIQLVAKKSIGGAAQFCRFIKNYPRLTGVAVIAVPIVLPSCRSYFRSQACRMVCCLVGLVRRSFHDWLFGQYDDQLRIFQDYFDKQRTVLDIHTGQFLDLRKEVTGVHADTQRLLSQYDGLIRQNDLFHEGVKAQIKNVNAAIHGLGSRLTALGLQVGEGDGKCLLRMDTLEANLTSLSAEQQKVLMLCRQEMNSNFERLNEMLRILSAAGNRHAVVHGDRETGATYR